ncbi:A24 family peptidase [Paenibacillus sp.]|uniref:A24 family peptidase n=1 Tax=Paenibacillus sp. TaxID=58172 RepID=UPI002D3A7719|nr:A24 family peptidase [Paenibacillus sp.]HZG88518.1 A24 family peptidase [Paenibacillus sp.]
MSEPMIGFLLFAAVSTLWDARTRRLPNGLAAVGCLAALIAHGFGVTGNGVIFAAAGAAAGLLLALPLYALKAVGGGDVKWFGAAGAFVGTKAVVWLLAGAVIASGAAALVCMAASPRFRGSVVDYVRGLLLGVVLRERTRLPEPAAKFPFMLSVWPAIAAVFLWTD